MPSWQQRFADAGLRDLCVEAGVIADGSISGVIYGHKYNRAVRLHKLLYEAFLRLAWEAFQPWLEEDHQEDIIHLDIIQFCKQSTTCVRKYHRQNLRKPSGKIRVSIF